MTAHPAPAAPESRVRRWHERRHREMTYDKMPCGNCDAGTYAIEPIFHGLRTYGHCQTKREALRLTPRCKHDAGHICYGALNWIDGTKFPMTQEAVAYIHKEYGPAPSAPTCDDKRDHLCKSYREAK